MMNAASAEQNKTKRSNAPSGNAYKKRRCEKDEAAIPVELLKAAQKAQQSLMKCLAECGKPRQSFSDVVIESLGKLGDPEHCDTPELQLRAISRMTSSIKEAVAQSENNEKFSVVPESACNAICHDFVVPFLLDSRVRYLHRPLTNILRSLFRHNDMNVSKLQNSVLESLKGSQMDKKVPTDLFPGANSMVLGEHEKECVLKFLNNLDCLSSTLIPLVPTIFANTFVDILPLLGDSLRWCVYNAEASATDRQPLCVPGPLCTDGDDTGTVLGEDLDRIRFCVRVVASHVHKYMDHVRWCAEDMPNLNDYFCRLLEPCILMLTSYRFPKDLLNATGLLFASIMTAREGFKDVLGILCLCICSPERFDKAFPASTASNMERRSALVTLVASFCEADGAEANPRFCKELDMAVRTLFLHLTTHGRFALLKGFLSHLSSPIRDRYFTLSSLMGPLPATLNAFSIDKGQTILYDFIIPLTQKYCRAIDLPDTRFMAIQTVDCALRHVSAVLGQVRRLVSENVLPDADARDSLIDTCIDPSKICGLIKIATQLTMEVWDDSTTQVSGALYGTYGVLLSINALCEGFLNDFSFLQSKKREEDRLLNLQETLHAVLSIQSDRRGKYHALLSLLASLPCVDFINGVCTSLCTRDEEGRLEDGISKFCTSLLSVASNHKVASVAGDTLSALVGAIVQADAKKEIDNGKELIHCILRTLCLAMIKKGFLATPPNISESNQLSHISGHFIGTVLKQKKSLFNEMMNCIFDIAEKATTAAVPWKVSQERLSQSIIEVLTRAKSVGIEISGEIGRSDSPARTIVYQSLQSHRFEQRITALTLLIFPSKKSERVTESQMRLMERFMSLNMHLGGDSASRKMVVDIFQKWVRRLVDSVELMQNKIKDAVAQFKNDTIKPHILRLTDVFVTNIGVNLSMSKGLSVERKVEACACLRLMIEGLYRDEELLSSFMHKVYEPVFIEVILGELSDGWSQMRHAARQLLDVMTRREDFCVAICKAKDLKAMIEKEQYDVETEPTFRGAEGSAQRGIIFRIIDSKFSAEVAQYFASTLESNMKTIYRRCAEMGSLHGSALYTFVTENPLHGLLSLCSEAFSCLHKASGESTDFFALTSQLFHCCSLVIHTCGTLVGHEVLEEGELVDCRGHVYDKNSAESESLMRYVVNNTWLGMRVATSCLQRAIMLVNVAKVELETIKKIAYDLVNALLLTKHNGVMRCVRASLKSLTQALIRSRSLDYYRLPSELLIFLLGPNGVSSEDVSRMLRRSQGLPHAVLAILEAEDESAPPVLFPIAMKTLLSVAANNENYDTVALSQRSNALNVLKFIFEDKMFGERVTADMETAFMIATSGFEHSSWSIRNSSLMLFSAVVQRFVGEHPSLGGGGVNTSLHDIAKRTPRSFAYTLNELCRGASEEKVEEQRISHVSLSDISMLPLLQMLSMLSPDPPHLLHRSSDGETDTRMIDAVSRCTRSRNFMIRTASAVALPSLVSPPDIDAVVLRSLQHVRFDAEKATSNAIHGFLLQLQGFLINYVGTLRRKQRVFRSSYANEETGKMVSRVVLSALYEGLNTFVKSSLSCPVIGSLFLSLASDMMSYGASKLPNEGMIEKQLCALVESGLRVATSSVAGGSQILYGWNGAERGGLVEAASLFFLMTLKRVCRPSTKNDTILLPQLRALCNHLSRLELLPQCDAEIYSFSACVCHHIHTYYSEKLISDDDVRLIIDFLKKDLEYDFISVSVRAITKDFSASGTYSHTQKSINRSNYFKCLFALWPLVPIRILPASQIQIFSALWDSVQDGHYLPWCSEAVKLLSASAASTKDTELLIRLISAVEWWSMPQRPQNIRMATLDALPYLVDLTIDKDRGLPSDIGDGGAASSSLLLTLLSFLVDDSFDVRDRASAICTTFLFGDSLIQDSVTCALRVVAVLRVWRRSSTVSQAAVHSRLQALWKLDTFEDEQQEMEGETLFNKENDNMFAEENVLQFYENAIFSDDLPNVSDERYNHVLVEILSQMEQGNTRLALE